MKLINLLLLAVLTLSANCFAHEDHDKAITKPIPKISVQLWSVKDELKEDFKNTIEQLAKLGFQGVEFARDFGPFENDAEG
jgi:hypothetical protein